MELDPHEKRFAFATPEEIEAISLEEQGSHIKSSP